MNNTVAPNGLFLLIRHFLEGTEPMEVLEERYKQKNAFVLTDGTQLTSYYQLVSGMCMQMSGRRGDDFLMVKDPFLLVT